MSVSEEESVVLEEKPVVSEEGLPSLGDGMVRSIIVTEEEDSLDTFKTSDCFTVGKTVGISVPGILVGFCW